VCVCVCVPQYQCHLLMSAELSPIEVVTRKVANGAVHAVVGLQHVCVCVCVRVRVCVPHN
jgi:hypothetical protein